MIYLSFNSVIKLFSTSAEFFCNKVMLTMLHYDLLTPLDLFSDKVLCTMISFDSSLSVTLMFDDETVFSA